MAFTQKGTQLSTNIHEQLNNIITGCMEDARPKS
jgi:hypothetical protein